MTETELRTMLRVWGRVFGPAPAKEWDEDSSEDLAGDTHVLMRAARGLRRSSAHPCLLPAPLA
jgi:hypothetical protein